MNRSVSLTLIGLLLCLLAGPPALDAQVRKLGRQGLWVSIGAGAGLAGFSCNGCIQASSTGGFVGFIGLGARVKPKLHLSLEADGWVKTVNGNKVRLGILGGVFQFYPNRQGFFLKAGLGASRAQGDQVVAADTTNVSTTGLGYLLGLGYDAQVGQHVSITGIANFYGGRATEGQDFYSIGFTVLQLLVGLTIHK